MQWLAVAPLSPRSQRIKDLEAMVESQNQRFRETIGEAQSLIDKANMEARGIVGHHPAPWPLSAMPTPFEFGGFRSNPPRASPIVTPRPHHPPPPFPSPPMGVGSVGTNPRETPFLSARGSLLSHVEISREVRKNREEHEERKRGTALSNAANK